MIKTGFYEADITPAIGMERPGNYFKVFIREIREQLKVRACYITDGKTEVALVGIDTCSISPEISDPVKEELIRLQLRQLRLLRRRGSAEEIENLVGKIKHELDVYRGTMREDFRKQLDEQK